MRTYSFGVTCETFAWRLLLGAREQMHIFVRKRKAQYFELKLFDVTEQNLVAPVTGISAALRLAARRMGVC